MRTLFWAFFPDEGLLLLVMVAGFALMLGFRQAAVSLLGTVFAFALLGPFIESFVAGLDPFWQLVVLVILGLVILRVLIVAILGRSTASHLLALILHDLILLPFRFLIRLLGGRPGNHGH